MLIALVRASIHHLVDEPAESDRLGQIHRVVDVLRHQIVRQWQDEYLVGFREHVRGSGVYGHR